jgi:hypothetical protein
MIKLVIFEGVNLVHAHIYRFHYCNVKTLMCSKNQIKYKKNKTIFGRMLNFLQNFKVWTKVNASYGVPLLMMECNRNDNSLLFKWP